MEEDRPQCIYGGGLTHKDRSDRAAKGTANSKPATLPGGSVGSIHCSRSPERHRADTGYCFGQALRRCGRKLWQPRPEEVRKGKKGLIHQRMGMIESIKPPLLKVPLLGFFAMERTCSVPLERCTSRGIATIMENPLQMGRVGLPRPDDDPIA